MQNDAQKRFACILSKNACFWHVTIWHFLAAAALVRFEMAAFLCQKEGDLPQGCNISASIKQTNNGQEDRLLACRELFLREGRE